MVMQSQNSQALTNKLKQVTHADQIAHKSGVGGDSEDPTEEVDHDGQERMDVQDRDSNSRGSRRNQDEDSEDAEMRFVLISERYLIGHDIRGIVHLEAARFGVVAWNDTKVYSVDRDKPDAVIHFNMPQGERNSISMRLIPFYDPN